jgi:hypothetical protein
MTMVEGADPPVEEPREDDTSVVEEPWFWILLGGSVAALTVAAIFIIPILTALSPQSDLVIELCTDC